MQIRTPAMLALGTLWLALLAAGFGVQQRYAATPGDAPDPPMSWPDASALPHTRGIATMLTFLHPHCPCTRSTLDNLARAIPTGDSAALRHHIVIVVPPGAPDGWHETPIAHRCAELSGATLHIDRDGVEARRFNARTSGVVMLYGADGSLVYSGGVTASRGHAGPSLGARLLVQRLGEPGASFAAAPVYGCPLLDPDACRGGYWCTP